jgi:hypothetical protein
MKKLTHTISVFIIFTSLLAHSEDFCEPKTPVAPSSGLDKFAAKMSVITSTLGNDKLKVESASTYLTSLYGHSDFDTKETTQFINLITPICESNNADKKFASHACTKLSGLRGKLAQKKGMSGVEDGKFAYNYIKRAQDLDPTNEEAAKGYALAIVRLYQKGYLIRKMAESSLSIKISDEGKKAKDNLERLKLTDSSIYADLAEVLK